MKILILTEYNPYIENSATANRFRGLIDGLRELGHTLRIGVVGGKLLPTEKNDYTTVYLSKANHYNPILGRLNTYFFSSVNQSIASLNLRQELKRNKYDVVWLGSSACVLDLFNRNLDKLKCKSFIELNEFDNIHEEKGSIGNWLQKKKALTRHNIFNKAVSSVDLFAIMTKTLLSYYKGKAKPDSQFIHLPMTVDFERFKIKKNADTTYQQPYIAYIGTFNNNKDGVDVLIKAFAKIAQKYPDFHLYLAGFWHYDVAIQKQIISQEKLDDRVTYIGKLDSTQIPEFIINSRLLALARPDSHQAQGGFPTKLGEYLATGNPVCVTKVGEIPNYLKDNESAFLAEPGDVDSFAAAMDRALSNPELAMSVGMQGRKVAETEFNAKIQAKRLADFLNNLTASDSHA